MSRMKSPNQSHFSQVPQANITRSSFDRSHGYKTTFDSSFLIPFYVDEALPGDSFKLNATLFARLSTPLKPIMDNMRMSSFFFSVPNRLIWENWQRFQGEQDDPDDSIDFLVPKLSGAAPIAAGSVYDYMGIPPGTVPDQVTISALPLRAMNLIYNEWFRDQNLQDSLVVDKDDSADPIGRYQLLRRGKRHDYFTSCLPSPQKSDAITIPIGGQAPIMNRDVLGNGGDSAIVDNTGGNPSALTYGIDTQIRSVNPGNDNTLKWSQTAAQFELNAGAYADLTQATAVTINALRESFAIQRPSRNPSRISGRNINAFKRSTCGFYICRNRSTSRTISRRRHCFWLRSWLH